MPNILIVEDDPAVRDIVQIALEREGLSVEAVADGEAALKRFQIGRGVRSGSPRHNAPWHRRDQPLSGT